MTPRFISHRDDLLFLVDTETTGVTCDNQDVKGINLYRVSFYLFDLIGFNVETNFNSVPLTAQALENVKELQNEVEDVRNEYQCISAASKEKEIQHLNDIESWNDSLNSKEEELIKLREQIQQRERQIDVERLQDGERETERMEHFAARFQKSKQDYETRLQTAEEEKSKLNDELRQLQTERDEAVREVEVFQIKMDTQLAAMEEQHEEERSMLQARWNQQMDEISSQQQRQVSQLQRKVDEASSELEVLRKENTNLRKQCNEVEEVFIQRMERLQLEHKEKLQTTVQQAMESGIFIADEAQKSSNSNHLRPDVMTSIPLSVQRHGSR